MKPMNRVRGIKNDKFIEIKLKELNKPVNAKEKPQYTNHFGKSLVK